jgi:chorismate mutase
MRVLALRGAITVDDDSAEEIKSRTIQLLETVYERNGLVHDDVISVLFTATRDITSAPPGVGARVFGLVDVPLLCTQEHDVVGSLGRCVRLMMHVQLERQRSELRHVFLRGATVLRPELVEPGDGDLP